MSHHPEPRQGQVTLPQLLGGGVHRRWPNMGNSSAGESSPAQGVPKAMRKAFPGPIAPRNRSTWGGAHYTKGTWPPYTNSGQLRMAHGVSEASAELSLPPLPNPDSLLALPRVLIPQALP